MSSKNPPQAYPVDGAPSNLTLTKAYEKHPDGGLTPIDPARRGDVTLPCPNCGGPLVRNASRDLWDKTFVKCPACKHDFAGEDYKTEASQNRD